jgi:hypothetical protein
MSTSPGHPAPITPTVCEHILADGHTNRPLALLAFDHDIAAYLCPMCLADEIETLIQHQTPEDIGAAISFAHCVHTTERSSGAHSHCHVCEVAGTSALSQRWAELTFEKPQTANDLGKLLRLLRHAYDRAGVREIDPAQYSLAPATTVYSPQMLRAESLNGDRARAAVKWDQGRVQRQSTLRPPVQTVSVAPRVQRTAVA